MTRKSYQETDQFQIKAENGSLYNIVETTSFLHTNTHSGNHVIPSLKELRTDNGFHVNFDGDQKYTIVELGLNGARVA